MTYIQYATAGRDGFLAFYSPQAEVSCGAMLPWGPTIPQQASLLCISSVVLPATAVLDVNSSQKGC